MSATRFHIESKRRLFSNTYEQIFPVTHWEFREDLWQRVGGPLLSYMADQRIVTGGFEEINR